MLCEYLRKKRTSEAMRSSEDSSDASEGEAAAALLDTASSKKPSLSYFPITSMLFNAVNTVVGGGSGNEHATENKMNVDDFVKAVEIDDVLIQAIQFSQRKRLMQVFTTGDLSKMSISSSNRNPDR